MAILEFDDISAGMYTMDRVIKKAPIGTLRHGTVSGGHYLMVFTGSTASVEESYRDAETSSAGTMIDQVLFSDVDAQLYNAITSGSRRPASGQALAVFESPTVASLAEAAEKALKGTSVDLVEFRMADPDLDGKSLLTFHGELFDIEEAARLSSESFQRHDRTYRQQILTSPHEDFTRSLNQASSFSHANTMDLEGE